MGLNLLGGGFDAREFLAVIIPGQVHPAHKVIAFTGCVLKPGLGLGQGVFPKGKIVFGNKCRAVFRIDLNHVVILPLSGTAAAAACSFFECIIGRGKVKGKSPKRR